MSGRLKARFLFISLWTPVTEFTPNSWRCGRRESGPSRTTRLPAGRNLTRLAWRSVLRPGKALRTRCSIHSTSPWAAALPLEPCAQAGRLPCPPLIAMRSACAGGDDRIVREPGPETWPEQPSPLRQPDRALAGALGDRALTGACRRRRVAGVAAHTSQGPCGPQPVHRADSAPEPARGAAASGPACGGAGPR